MIYPAHRVRHHTKSFLNVQLYPDWVWFTHPLNFYLQKIQWVPCQCGQYQWTGQFQVCSLPPPFPGDNLKQTTLSGQPRAVWKSGYPKHCKSWYNPAVFQAIRCSKCRGFAEWPRWEEQKEQIADHYLARVDWTGHKPGKMGRNF